MIIPYQHRSELALRLIRLALPPPWQDLSKRYGPYTTCYNRFNRRRKKGIWDHLNQRQSQAYFPRLLEFGVS